MKKFLSFRKPVTSRGEMSTSACRQKSSDLVSLSTTLKSFFSKEYNADHIFTVRLWQAWSQIAKKNIFKNTKPVSFKNGQLVLWISSAAEMQEIHFHIEELKQNIKEHFKTNRVESIHFTFNRDVLLRKQKSIHASEFLF